MFDTAGECVGVSNDQRDGEAKRPAAAKPTGGGRDVRAERLAEQLRANLKKRKALARTRGETGKTRDADE